jgi:hypothetical protein
MNKRWIRFLESISRFGDRTDQKMSDFFDWIPTKFIWVKELIFILKNYRFYRYWKKKHKGVKFADLRRGLGSYIDFWYKEPLGQIYEKKDQYDRIMLYELIYYKMCTKPNNLIKYSLWDLIGYDRFRPIAECTFREFMSVYGDKIKVK